jgi:fructoselysine-6-P-deglycase FrlB-like protein
MPADRWSSTKARNATTVIETTPFESDILEQPEALRCLVTHEETGELDALAARPWDRIVLTGMGSSHFVGMPTWSRLVNRGLPAWSVDSGQLLETPGLLTDNTLLIVTSQSGASGEVVEILDRLTTKKIRVGSLIGVAADSLSPLATAADLYLPLRSGVEATVSTKSYLNTLAVHRRIISAFTDEPHEEATADIATTADAVQELLECLDPEPVGREIDDLSDRRLAAIGKGDAAATALYAGLITKESSKVAIEGYVGGQFRHGPFELAGPGLLAFLYGAYNALDDGSISRLADDLLATGSHVVLIGDMEVDGARTLYASSATPLQALATASVVAQLVAVDIARARDVVPGAFAFGSKITTAL